MPDNVGPQGGVQQGAQADCWGSSKKGNYILILQFHIREVAKKGIFLMAGPLKKGGGGNNYFCNFLLISYPGKKWDFFLRWHNIKISIFKCTF